MYRIQFTLGMNYRARLVMMSVSLCNKTALHCLIIQVLNTRV